MLKSSTATDAKAKSTVLARSLTGITTGTVFNFDKESIMNEAYLVEVNQYSNGKTMLVVWYWDSEVGDDCMSVVTEDKVTKEELQKKYPNAEIEFH